MSHNLDKSHDGSHDESHDGSHDESRDESHEPNPPPVNYEATEEAAAGEDVYSQMTTTGDSSCARSPLIKRLLKHNLEDSLGQLDGLEIIPAP